MIQRLEDLGRSWELHYCARNRRKCAYLKQIQALDAVLPGRQRLHFDDECNGALIDLGARVADVASDAHLYCCGPAAMLKVFEQATLARARNTVHVEYFSAKHEAATKGGFTLVLARSDRQLEVPAGCTILDVVLEAGIDAPFSCTQGVCGACETRVLEGVVDHRDAVLSAEEIACGKTMMICCSGSKSQRLVIEL